MGWIILFFIAYFLLFSLIPLKRCKELLHVGLFSLIVLYIIDSTLIKLGAYSFKLVYFDISGIPLLYLLSGLPGGMLLVHFLPPKKKWHLFYPLLASAIFLCIELIMVLCKYFYHHQWNSFNSYVLNIFGFSIVLWFHYCFDNYKK